MLVSASAGSGIMMAGGSARSLIEDDGEMSGEERYGLRGRKKRLKTDKYEPSSNKNASLMQ